MSDHVTDSCTITAISLGVVDSKDFCGTPEYTVSTPISWLDIKIESSQITMTVSDIEPVEGWKA